HFPVARCSQICHGLVTQRSEHTKKWKPQRATARWGSTNSCLTEALLGRNVLHRRETLVEHRDDVLRKRTVIKRRRIRLTVVDRPLDEVDELLALGGVGLRLVDEEIRERRDRIRVRASSVHERNAEVRVRRKLRRDA